MENGMIRKYISKFENLQPTAKAAICFTLCNLFLKGINLMTTPVFTRMISDYEYGTLSLFMSYEQFLLIFATWEISLGAYQKGIFQYKENLKLFTSSTLLLTNLITAVLFLLLFVFRKTFYSFTGMDTQILLLLFLFLLMQPAYSSFMIRKQTEYEYKPVILITTIYTLLNVLIPMIALVILGRTAKIKFCATLISSICVFIWIYWSGFKNYWSLRKYTAKVREQWKFIISFQLPLVLHSLSYLVLGQADRVMIGKMVGNAQAGFYSIAYTLASIISIIQNSLNQVFIPWCYRKMDEKAYKEIGKNTNYLLIGMGVLALGTILIAPELMKILFTKDYYEAVWSIPPITVGVYFVFLYSVFVNIESYFAKTTYIMYVSITCGILNVVLNFLFIDVFGYIVCGYTTMISYIVFAIGHYYFMRKVCRDKIPGVSIFDMKGIVLISVCVMICAVLVILLYPYWMIRYGILLIMAVVLFIYRKPILEFAAKTLKRDSESHK